MMNDVQEIRDDEIRVLGITADEGDDTFQSGGRRGCTWMSLLVAAVVCVAVLGMAWFFDSQSVDVHAVDAIVVEAEPSFFEPEAAPVGSREEWYASGIESLADKPHTEVMDTMINDIPLRIFIPHNAVMSLQRGYLDIEDTTIVYVAQAADIRADNGEIVGAFVINGEPLTRGVSKLGYCASVNGEIHIGMARNTDLFDRAVQTGGFFFRQYPLVHNGTLVENEPKGKSIRRSVCKRRGQVFMVETLSRESFHDFAQSLVDLGVDDAVYLVGSSTYGWAMDREGRKHEFGNEYPYVNGFVFPENINYIVWR